jgi:hypothetical protein
MGSSRFLAAIAAEYLTAGDTCGPLEHEAYTAEWVCRSNNPTLTQYQLDYLMGCAE